MVELTRDKIIEIAESYGFEKSWNFNGTEQEDGKLFFTKELSYDRKLCLSYIKNLSTIDLFTSNKKMPVAHMIASQYCVLNEDELKFMLDRSGFLSDTRELIK